ncbi:tyrosine-type recombinase/integrase [Thalassotalea sp. SU-HH00458]|uniref:tyrosine-type recombinase/integrase n=1 Tax=Thalassotalea sp. SU-HH00458 TaxID=3127657 RepID=UPI003105AE6E
MALTVKQLDAIKPTGKRFEVSDKDGLSVRVSATGKKTFQYRYRKNGKQQRHDYGDYGAGKNQLTLAKAREVHYKTKNEISDGFYPNQLNTGSKEIKTVKDIFDSWYEIYCVKNRKNPEYARDLIAADITPQIGHIKPSKLTKAHFRDLLDIIIERGSMTQAEKCRAICKQVCKWAAERDYILSNPLQEFSASAIGYKYKPSDRFLNDEEIGIVWNGLDLSGMETPTINALKIMMLTGLRRSEPYLAKLSEIDFKNKVWKIPKENNKSDRANEIMLSSLLIEVLENQIAYCESIGGSTWLFPSIKDTAKHIDSNSATRAVKRHCDRNHWVNEEGGSIPDWTPHALRHTFETKLTEIGIEYIVMKRMINHAIGGMSDIYNHAQLNDKKLEAMEKWSDKIRGCING